MTPLNALRSFAQFLLDNTVDVPIHVKLNSEADAGGQILDVEAVNVNFSSYDKTSASAVVSWRELKVTLHIISADAETAAGWADQLVTALNAGRAALAEVVEGELVPVANRYVSWEPAEATDFGTEATSTHAYWYASFNIRYKQ